MGSLRNANGDGDGNENVTNVHIQWAKTIALHSMHVPSSAKQQLEIANFKFEVL